MRAKLILLLPLLALAELKDVVVSGQMNLLHYVAKELASPKKDYTKLMDNGLLKACKMDPLVFYTDILFYVFECHSDVKSISVSLPGSNNYLDGYQVDSFDVQMEHTDSPKLKHVVSCPVGITDPSDFSCSTYVLDFYRAAPDIATLETMAVSSKKVIVVDPPFNSGTSSYSITVEIDTPFSISARTLQAKGLAGITAPDGAGLSPDKNGCDKAEQSQAVWEFPGFRSTGVFTFDICAVAPDNIHQTWYALKVNVTRHYSTRLRSLSILGKRLEPAFDPEVQQYTVHIDGKTKEVGLSLTAEDDEAAIKVDADKITHGSDSIDTTVKMHDNENLKVGEPPQWSRSIGIQLESADGEKTLTYLVHVKQSVSNYSKLLNLSMDNTSCKMDPPVFQANVTKYRCVFWWTETESPRVIATMDPEKCPDCTLLIPSAREFPKSHLSLQYHSQIKRVHQSGEVWTRPFLYGEYHEVPFQVLSADKFTHTTYKVHLERDAPWWMKAATTRAISSWATVLATSMAIFSASNFVALTRMIQFMDLTTEIKGRPDVYNEFAQHLKGFNFDPTPFLPDCGLPSMEEVRDIRNKAVEQLKEKFAVGEMKKSGTLVLQYCYALKVEGRLAANGILHSHGEETKFLLQSLDSMDEMFQKKKRKLILDDAFAVGAANPTAWKGGNFTYRSLRGIPKYSGDVSGDPASLRSLKDLTSRRLDGDKEEKDEDDEDVEAPNSALMVVQWTGSQWEEFIKKMVKENVTEDDYPEAQEKIPCGDHPMSDVIPFLYLMHELELVRRMMHTYTGTFILMFLIIFGAGCSYIMYYRTVMMKSQRRVKWLEPGFLSIFVLDCGLIGFTKSAAKIISQPTVVTFFFWKPERWEVQAFVFAGIILYPVVFVILTYFLVYDVTTKLIPEKEREASDPDTKMVFNEDVEQWIDPTAKEIKVTLEPPIPSWIPVLGEMITSHVRSCIPVLTVDGAPISFRTDVEEVRPEKPKINREELEKEAMALEEKMNSQLESHVTKETKKAREKRVEQVKKEKELHQQIRKRQEGHGAVIEDIKEKMKNEAEKYPKEGDIQPDGPSGDPTWFPSGARSEDEEEEFVFEKINIHQLLEEWASVKNREDSEVLDAEESFAIRSYIEGHIRREKRLTKYNIMKVAPYKGHILPKEPFLIVKKKNPDDGKWMEVREVPEKSCHWWFPKDENALKTEDMEWELDDFGFGQKYIQNSTGQRLVYKSGTVGFFARFFGRLKVGDQEAGELFWMDEPEEGWDGFNNMKGKAGENGAKGKYQNLEYADKWQWIYFDKWDLPWSSDDEDEKKIFFCGCSVQKDEIPLFRIAEKGLMKRYKTYVPYKIRENEKNEIRMWVWKGLVNFTQLKLKLGWMSKQHPKYYDQDPELGPVDELNAMVEKPFEDLLIDLAHAKASKSSLFSGEREGGNEELLHFTLMKFEDLFPDNEEPWWEESDKPADNERKVMFDHSVFFEDSATTDSEFKHRRSQNQLLPEHGYHSSSCFSRFPDDTFGKKRYVIKKPDDPVESIARVEMNVRMKHVLPLMRYTSDFKACVPINSLELPLRSNLQIILKESGHGEQFNYTVDRLTNLISIGVLASQPPGPVCAITLLLLQLVNFVNRFWTNKVSAEQSAARLAKADEEEEAKNANSPEKEPLNPGAKTEDKKKAALRKKRLKMAHKNYLDSFLEVEVFKMFLQSLVLFLLCAGQFGWMPNPICALLCILVCVFTMIFMNVSTFRKEFNKQIDSISQSITEMYRMYRGYENSVRTWLSGENFFGIVFMNFEGLSSSDLENVANVNFVVPELGLRLKGKTVVDDLLPPDEKMKQQLLKYTAYYANIREDAKVKVGCASDLQRYYEDIAPSFTLALSVDQLKLCKPIPPLAATIQCVNHAGSSISHPDFDSYLTLYYPEEWEEENDQDKEAVKFLNEMWSTQVKEWMENSLGATYSERTYTKKIQEHVAALMGMPWEMDKDRHCVVVKVEHILIPKYTQRMSIREKIAKDLDGKMVFVTVLYEDEDFSSDLAPDRTSPLGRIEKLTEQKLQVLMARGEVEATPKHSVKGEDDALGDVSGGETPAMKSTKSHASFRPGQGKLSSFLTMMVQEGDEKPWFSTLEECQQFGYICEHGQEFKIPIPATVSKFKLMVWFQNDESEDPKKSIWTEELLGFSEHFDLILPDEAELMGEDEADQKRIIFYTSWHSSLTQGLQRIQESEEDTGASKSWFRRMRSKIRDYFSPPITKADVKRAMGFVDMSVRNVTQEEIEEDRKYVLAVKDVVEGNSEINKQKLKRHLDRRGILSTFFGLRMDESCIGDESKDDTLKGRLKKLQEFRDEHQAGASSTLAAITSAAAAAVSIDTGRKQELETILLNQGIRRTLWDKEVMEAAIQSIEDAIKGFEEKKGEEASLKIKTVPRYKIDYRYRGPHRTTENPTDFDSAVLAELIKFKKDQAKMGKAILHYVMVADHLKPNKVWRPDAISPHVCGIIVNNLQDVPSVRLQCQKFSSDIVFNRETLESSKDELPAFLNARLCFKAEGAEAEKYYKAMDSSPEQWKVDASQPLQSPRSPRKSPRELPPNAPGSAVPTEMKYKPVYLYWDGFARWVVSPFRGEPTPYGLATDKNQHLFLYCRDNATTPDRISKTKFMKWDTENSKWKEDTSVRVLNQFGSVVTQKEADRAEQLRSHAKNLDNSAQSSWLGEMFKGLMFIFMSTTSKKSTPEIKECLIGLEGGNITIAWKDIHQESLAPLRKFLLEEFGSYQAAWVFLCRRCTIRKSHCVRNLARMMRRCLEELKALQKVRKKQEAEEGRKKFQKEKKVMQKLTKSSTKAIEEAKQKEDKKKMEKDKEKFEEAVTASKTTKTDGGAVEAAKTGASESPKKKANLFSSMLNKTIGAVSRTAGAAANTVGKTLTTATAAMGMDDGDEEKARKNEKKMMEYLSARVTEDITHVESICKQIMDALDQDEDGTIVVQEILGVSDLMDSSIKDKELKEFIAFLKVHPKWANVEQFWADLSEGFEIMREEFVEACEILLQRFTKQQQMARAMDSHMTVDQRCSKVFSQLDVQMSGGIGLNELIPMSGERMEDADSNLAKFKIPLNYIKEIRIDAARTSSSGEEQRQTVRFQVAPDFENSPEWRMVKKGLSPDWEPNTNFEFLQVAMVPQYLDMWKQVIKDCGMDTVQEFIRFFQGSVMEHPKLDGVYMRSGTGTQRWPDGKTYQGTWDNHVYEGEGALYNDYEDMASEVKPIYIGSWKLGKRHGFGIMRWEQDNSDRHRKTFGDRQFSGVRKIYEGEFQHDLFHGEGKMRLEKAVAQSLRTMDHQGMSPGRVPLPNLDPGYILSFEGQWESDWYETDLEAREVSPLYANLHQQVEDELGNIVSLRDLKFDGVTKLQMQKNDQIFARYFSLDPMDVQAAGDPLPDLALAYYQVKGGDANHMKEGSAVYADFTEYNGFYQRGVPHGRGKMTQFDHKDGKKGAELAAYTGEWQNGKFHGNGTYTTTDGLKYEGQFEENCRHGWGVETATEKLAAKIGYSKYEGEWKNGVFHGKGELTYGDPIGGMGRVVFEGTFENGKRTGVGKAYNVKDKHIKLHCKFDQDKIITSKKDEDYAWVCFDRRKEDSEGPGKYFYGILGQDGELGTWGTMYSARAANDPDFLECVREGKPYKKENPEDETVKYILYHGQWKDSVPDGFGVQHFEGAQLLFEKNPMHQSHGGTYTGDFVKGKRHGRGVWKTLGGNWEFRPIANEDVPNWENDLMHGIGIVEDSEHVHENVIYTKGKCQMPFTELGPPKTGFESAAFTDVLPQASRKRIYVTPLPTTEDPELEKTLPDKNNPIWTLVKGFGQKLEKKEDEGWEALDRRHELAFLRATALSVGHSHQAITRMNSAVSAALTMRSMPTTAAAAEPTAAALVREPTDLSLPEEDVLIKGGTGENEVINGVYFKLMHTFGVKAFKMVKPGSFYESPTVRYLYWDHVTNTWTISPKPLVGVCLAPGCAFAQEDNTEHPSMVTKPWYVWHGYSGELLAAGEEIKEEEEKKGGFSLRTLMGPPAPVDKIVAKSIVGFQVQGNQDKLGKIGMGLMLRIPLTLFGRPVYEYEGGGQYLYYHRKESDGTFSDLAKGQDADLEEFGAGIEPTPEKLFENDGCWIIATDMGTPLDSPECFAYVEDTAVTPDQISRNWQVRFKDKMEANDDLRFVAQEWSHEGTLQAMVDKAEKDKAEKEVDEDLEGKEEGGKSEAEAAKDGKAGKDGKAKADAKAKGK